MAHGFFKHIGNDAALSFTSSREIAEELTENLIGRNQVAAGKGTAGLHGGVMPLVLAMDEGHPIQRVGKNASHEAGRLGVP